MGVPPAGSGVSPKPSAVEYTLLQQTEYLYTPAGQLAEIKSNGATASTYRYDAKSRLTDRSYGNGIAGHYAYDAFGRQTRLDLSGGPLGDPLALAYEWDEAGQLKSRTWNGETQLYSYDLSGQLLTVSAITSGHPDSAEGPLTSSYRPVSTNPKSKVQTPKLIESYKYDSAGNMIEKREGDRTTTMTYNSANELVSSTSGGVGISYTYDEAGRLSSSQPGGSSVPQSAIHDPQLEYGFLDKVLAIRKPDGSKRSFDYWPDGQLAAAYEAADSSNPSPNPKSAIQNPKLIDDYLWDDLGLIYTNGEANVIEPHANGGSCVARRTDGKTSYDINDLLGTTLAVVSDTELKLTPLTAFGKPKTVAPEPGAPAPLEAPVAPPPNPNLQQQTMKTK